jgi:GNAT superfamily N-acetyltransferase
MPRILWVFNTDDVGHALADAVVYVMASRELEDRVAAVLKGFPDVSSINARRGGSDHQPFAERGVPAAWLTGSERPIPVHTALDTIDTLSRAKLASAARAAEAVCRDLLTTPLASRVTTRSAGTIRAAREADLKPIEGMLGSIWQMGRAAAMEERHGLIGGKPWQESVVPGIISNLTKRLEEGGLLVTECDGEVLGFISYSIDRERSIGTIGYNGVRRGAGGRGIGTRQVEYVLDIFRREGLRLAEVSTGLNEGHRPARRMYEKVGFKSLVESVFYTMEL